jgi:Ser/Thr protein kinase RdoA (MazF antagonist)
MLEQILNAYGIDHRNSIKPYGSGLINNTWKVTDHSGEYILQKINHHVFTQPENIAHNIQLIASYLEKNYPEYLFVRPVKTTRNEEILHSEKMGFFRLFPFVKNSTSMDVAATPDHAFQAAYQFGLFTKILSGFPASCLKTTIPDFHNLKFRYNQFEDACRDSDSVRKKIAADSIDFIRAHDHILTEFEEIRFNSNFKLRVTHHDTKISNVLFDENGKGLCVIDLDTVMPGYFISDVGDMMRTYLPAVSEEEKDIDKIEVRDEYFLAIVRGYLREMSTELSEDEIGHFVYSGLFMTYMQAIRFLADYLNNDAYYGATYGQQNHVRANNQITLLQKLLDKETWLNNKVMEVAKN